MKLIIFLSFFCISNALFFNNKNKNPCDPNPCKNDGKCLLDEKSKSFCECSPGWTSKTCDKRNCSIIEFKSKVFVKSSRKVFIDQSIESKMKDVEGLANLCKVKLQILKSFILHPDVKSLIFDAKDSLNPNFYIGQALNFEIFDQNDKILCNDVCLSKIPIPMQQAKCFVDGLKAINIKWTILDPSVLSTGFNIANTNNYNSLRAMHQIGCREAKFD